MFLVVALPRTKVLKLSLIHISDAVDRSHIVAEEKDIQISTRIEEVPEVYGDAELLGIAVQNLVENAVRYSPEHTKVDIWRCV